MEAMVQLGYRATDVEKIFAAIGNPKGTVEDLIKQALAMVSL
jgi:Holliday junction resolvasome RuvABC DNA-binding subunit